MMTIYQFIVYLSTKLINIIFVDKLRTFGLVSIFVILTIYHSLYSYNNLWQVIGLDISRRINIHERRWAYFLGYGLIATIMYMNIFNPYILALYNIYMGILLSIPLLHNFDFDFYFLADTHYCKIDLSFFSFVMKYLLQFSKKFIN